MAFRMARPAHLIDINDIAELTRMTVTDGVLRIGARVRHAAFDTGTLPGAAAALLRKVARHIPHYRTRTGFEEFGGRKGNFAIAMAVVSDWPDKGLRAELRLAIGGAEPPPRRATNAEDVLRGHALGADVRAENGGLCTRGFLMLAVGVLEKRPDLNEEEMVDILSADRCRCAGYANKAQHDAASDMKARA